MFYIKIHKTIYQYQFGLDNYDLSRYLAQIAKMHITLVIWNACTFRPLSNNFNVQCSLPMQSNTILSYSALCTQ